MVNEVGAKPTAGTRPVVLNRSCMGANKQQNQDWFAITRLSLAQPGEQATLLAVADGHGSKEYRRSDLGARYAVRAFQDTAAHFFAGTDPASLPESVAKNEFPRELALRWRRFVVLQAANNPPDGALPDAAGEQKATSESTFLLYGSTLIAVLVAPNLFAAWQIGDGDLFFVGAKREPRLLLPQKGPDLGDETDSLCHKDAASRFRVHWQPNVRPALVSLSTDGLSKSFADHDGFRGFCVGLFERLERGDHEAVENSLPTWLARAANHSGDDTTLCALYDPMALGRA